MQDMFPKGEQEVRLSFTHHGSRITLEEVRARNDDYERCEKKVIWVIDCTQNTNKPVRISGADEEEVWILEFDKKWQVDSMLDCSIVFADFGDHIFRLPITSIRHRMVAAFGSIPSGPAFASHLTSPSLELDVPAPKQSTLTVAQDPHGSGKTYALTRMIIFADTEEYLRYLRYYTFIVVTKPHSAKEVVFA